jgi:hypothetical protein
MDTPNRFFNFVEDLDADETDNVMMTATAYKIKPHKTRSYFPETFLWETVAVR